MRRGMFEHLEAVLVELELLLPLPHVFNRYIVDGVPLDIGRVDAGDVARFGGRHVHAWFFGLVAGQVGEEADRGLDDLRLLGEGEAWHVLGRVTRERRYYLWLIEGFVFFLDVAVAGKV